MAPVLLKKKTQAEADAAADELLQRVGLFSALAGALAARFGAELRVSSALLGGLLELSSGVSALRASAPGMPHGLWPSPGRLGRPLRGMGK